MTSSRQILQRLRAAYGTQPGWWPVDDAYHAREGTDPRFEICVGAILVQNTAWANARAALDGLKARRLLDASKIAAAPLSVVEKAIRSSGTFRRKARTLKRFASHVEETGRLDGLFRLDDVSLRARLLALPGIGEETADAMLLYAARRPAFVVDAYARRIAARMGVVPDGASASDVAEWWSTGIRGEVPALQEAHALVVRQAQAACRRRAPVCASCPVADLCPRVGI